MRAQKCPIFWHAHGTYSSLNVYVNCYSYLARVFILLFTAAYCAILYTMCVVYFTIYVATYGVPFGT